MATEEKLWFTNRLAMWQRILYNKNVGVRINDTESSKYHDNVFKFSRYITENEEEQEAIDYYGYNELVNYKKLYENQKERFFLKYKRFIDCINTKILTSAQFSFLKPNTQEKDNGFILEAAFFLGDETINKNFGEHRKMKVYVERQINYDDNNNAVQYIMKEIAFIEDRQTVVELMKQENQNLDLRQRKFNIVFFLQTNRTSISGDFKSESKKTSYLFHTSRVIHLDRKILNLLCPFKAIYEYKKLRLEPPMYWCYRYKRILDQTSRKHGMFQLALSRLQNQWCRGNSIFDTILLMRYFMMSWYILADDKPVLLNNKAENEGDNNDYNNLFDAFFPAEGFVDVEHDNGRKGGLTTTTRKDIIKLIKEVIEALPKDISNIVEDESDEEDNNKFQETIKNIIAYIFTITNNDSGENWMYIPLKNLVTLYSNGDIDTLSNVIQLPDIKSKLINQYGEDTIFSLLGYIDGNSDNIPDDLFKELCKNSIASITKNVREDLAKTLTVTENTTGRIDAFENNRTNFKITITEFINLFKAMYVDDNNEEYTNTTIKEWTYYDILREVEQPADVNPNDITTKLKDIYYQMFTSFHFYHFKNNNEIILCLDDIDKLKIQNIVKDLENIDSFCMLYTYKKTNRALELNKEIEIINKIERGFGTNSQDEHYYIEKVGVSVENLNVIGNQLKGFSMNKIVTILEDSWENVNGVEENDDLYARLKLVRDSLLTIIETGNNVFQETKNDYYTIGGEPVSEFGYIFQLAFKIYLKFANGDTYDADHFLELKQLSLCVLYKYLQWNDGTFKAPFDIIHTMLQSENKLDVINKFKDNLFLYLFLSKFVNEFQTDFEPENEFYNNIARNILPSFLKALLIELKLDTEDIGYDFFSYEDIGYYFFPIIYDWLQFKLGDNFMDIEKAFTDYFKLFIDKMTRINSMGTEGNKWNDENTKLVDRTPPVLTDEDKNLTLMELTHKKGRLSGREKNINGEVRLNRFDGRVKGDNILVSTMQKSFVYTILLPYCEFGGEKEKLWGEFQKYKIDDITNEYINKVQDTINSLRDRNDTVNDDDYVNDDDDDDEEALFNPPELPFLKELEQLFISAGAAEEGNNGGAVESEGNSIKGGTNFIDYVNKNDPTPENTIENMLEGFTEFLQHGIDLNDEANIQSFYVQTYKQFFQNMASSINKTIKGDKINKEATATLERTNRAASNKLKKLLTDFYSFEPFYKKHAKSKGYLVQGPKFKKNNETSIISFAHALETYESNSLSYPANSVHYQTYKIIVPDEDNAELINIKSANEYLFVNIDDNEAIDVNSSVQFSDNRPVSKIVGEGTVEQKVMFGNDTYVKIKITWGYCPEVNGNSNGVEPQIKFVSGESNLSSTNLKINDSLFLEGSKSQMIEDRRTIEGVDIKTICPYQVFLEANTSLVHPKKNNTNVRYFILNIVESNTGVNELNQIQDLPQEDDYKDIFTSITRTSPYVLYFCNYMFMEYKNQFRYGIDFDNWRNNDDDKKFQYWESINQRQKSKNELIESINIKTVSFDAGAVSPQNTNNISFVSSENNPLTVSIRTKEDGEETEVGSTWNSFSASSIFDNLNDNDNKIVTFIINYRPIDPDQIDKTDLQLRKLATYLHKYDDVNGLNLYKDFREKDIFEPFDETEKAYCIEYGTYEFLHHFLKGNLNKPNIYVKYRTRHRFQFQDPINNVITVLPIFKLYKFNFKEEEAFTFITEQDASMLNERVSIFQWDNNNNRSGILEDLYGYYETRENDRQKIDSNLNTFTITRSQLDLDKKDELEYENEETRARIINERYKEYAAIRFDHESDITTLGTNGTNPSYAIGNIPKLNHYGQLCIDELTLEGEHDLIVFYKNRPLSYSVGFTLGSGVPVDLKTVFFKNNGFLVGNNRGSDNNKMIFIRNFILETESINTLLKGDRMAKINGYNYGCFSIRETLFEAYKLETGNFTYNSAFMKYVLPVIFQVKNYSKLSSEINSKKFRLGKANRSLKAKLAKTSEIESMGKSSNVRAVKTDANYFVSMFLNSQELGKTKVQYRQALRKVEISYMDYCDYELFYNVFRSEIVETEKNFRMSNNLDEDEFSNITSGSVKNRWAFFVRLALYEKYNYFLPLLKKSVNGPTFERLFKPYIDVNEDNEIVDFRHGVYEQWVYIYCLGLTILLCE